LHEGSGQVYSALSETTLTEVTDEARRDFVSVLVESLQATGLF